MELRYLGRSGVKVSAIGMGTWGIGGFSSRDSSGDKRAIEALRLGIDLGMTFIDTAEIYARGHSEEVVAEAVHDRRDEVFIATKVSPEHFSYRDVLRSAEASLRRLRTSYVDLYQLHWPSSSIPIGETMRAMEHLVTEGRIRFIGVSNFSVEETREAQEALSRYELVSNQVEYSLLNREIERDLLAYCEKEKITVIAYSPLARGRIPQGSEGGAWRVLDEIARRYGRSRAQVALNWLINRPSVMAIPKASSPDHVRENAHAAGWKLSEEDYRQIDAAFR